MFNLLRLRPVYTVMEVLVGIPLLGSACGIDAEQDNMSQSIESPILDLLDHSQSQLQCFCGGDCGQILCCQFPPVPGALSGVCVPRTAGACSPPEVFPHQCTANNYPLHVP